MAVWNRVNKALERIVATFPRAELTAKSEQSLIDLLESIDPDEAEGKVSIQLYFNLSAIRLEKILNESVRDRGIRVVSDLTPERVTLTFG